MSGRSSRETVLPSALPSALAGALAGTTTVALAALAHTSAGGSLDTRPAIVCAAVLGLVGAIAASCVRITFWRAALVTIAAQPMLHLAFDGFHPRPHQHVGHHTMEPAPAHAGGTDTRMLVAHVAVALGAAVLMRWGLRWLRSMPEVARAIVVPPRSVVVPITLRAHRAPAVAIAGGAQSLVSRWWDNRGPPE